MIRLALALGVALAFLPTQGSMARPLAGSAHGVRVDTVRHGLDLAIIAPHRTYARFALARIRVRLTNVSQNPVLVGYGCPSGPALDVVSSGPPPSIPNPYTACRKWVPPLTLQPGASTSRAVYVVISGPQVYSEAQLYVHSGNSYIGRLMTGRPATVRLVPGTAPRMTVRMSPRWGWVADVRPSAHERTRPLFLEHVLCPNGGGAGQGATFSAGGTQGWTPAPPATGGVYEFIAGCAQPQQWQLAVAWLNQPIVAFLYPPGAVPPPGR